MIETLSHDFYLRLRTLSEVAHQLAEASDMHSFFEAVILAGQTKLGYDRVIIWLNNEQDQSLSGTLSMAENGLLQNERDVVCEAAEALNKSEFWLKERPLVRHKNLTEFDHSKNQGQCPVGEGEPAGGTQRERPERPRRPGPIGFLGAVCQQHISGICVSPQDPSAYLQPL